MLFEKFGEMSSAAELNELAANLKKEGDTASIKTLCEENGIDAEVAQCFIDGDIEWICDAVSAAIGKIDVEEKELKCVEIMHDWAEYVRSLAAESTDVAIAIRKKGKSLSGCIGEILKWSYTNAYSIQKEIMEAAGIKGANVKMGIPGRARAQEMIRQYYGQ